jgi:hypothetical protein
MKIARTELVFKRLETLLEMVGIEYTVRNQSTSQYVFGKYYIIKVNGGKQLALHESSLTYIMTDHENNNLVLCNTDIAIGYIDWNNLIHFHVKSKCVRISVLSALFALYLCLGR